MVSCSPYVFSTALGGHTKSASGKTSAQNLGTGHLYLPCPPCPFKAWGWLHLHITRMKPKTGLEPFFSSSKSQPFKGQISLKVAMKRTESNISHNSLECFALSQRTRLSRACSTVRGQNLGCFFCNKSKHIYSGAALPLMIILMTQKGESRGCVMCPGTEQVEKSLTSAQGWLEAGKLTFPDFSLA